MAEILEGIAGFLTGVVTSVLLLRYYISDYVVERLNGRYASKDAFESLKEEIRDLREEVRLLGQMLTRLHGS